MEAPFGAEPDDLSKLVHTLDTGKRLADAVYVHISVLDGAADDRLKHVVARAAFLAGIPHTAFNVVKIALDGPRVSLLSYPRFFEEGFPTLTDAWAIDLAKETCAPKSYRARSNPPVLHRKELLLAADHPARARFETLTQQAEALGLFESPTEIGTRDAWEARLARLRLRVVDHELVSDAPAAESVEVQRHRTALTRYALSTPMQALWRHGYLDGENTVFDYGCGRGDDVAALRTQGVTASGWDPHFAADRERVQADVVNLGFVLNVIEDAAERAEALRTAFKLAKRVLAVAVLIGGRNVFEKHRLYRDGVLTQRGTFQKYYSQGEIRDYVGCTLGREPVALAPGVFFIFPNDDEEQRFLERRQRSSGLLGALPRPARERPERAERAPRAARPKAPTKWELHAELIEAFYARALELGRLPEVDEFSRTAELRDALGKPATVLNRVLRERSNEAFLAAQRRRRGDLLVYLALNVFERRKSIGHLPEGTRRDIRALWNSYANAQAEAQALLFSVGRPETIAAACREASEAGIGYLDGEHNLQLHASLTPALPPVLRVYLGCAARLYGDVDSADLVKIHITSGKLSLMSYDDFDGKAVPLLIERVKIDMRRQEIFFYEYGEDNPQALYLKSRFMHPSMPSYDAQTSFDRELEQVERFDLSGYGPPALEFTTGLQAAGLAIRGFKLVPLP